MAKATKTAKAPMFIKPTMEEVINFIDVTMRDWPRSFCEIMGEKFFESYQSLGWRLSKNIPMKNWHSAWNGRWKHNLSFADKKLLEEHLRLPVNQMKAAQARRESAGMYADELEPTVGSAKPIDYYITFYDVMIGKYIAGQVKERELASHYDRLKKMGLMRLPKPQIDQILVDMGNDRDRGKGMSVARLFLNLQARNQTLKDYYAEIQQKRLSATNG